MSPIGKSALCNLTFAKLGKELKARTRSPFGSSWQCTISRVFFLLIFSMDLRRFCACSGTGKPTSKLGILEYESDEILIGCWVGGGEYKGRHISHILDLKKSENTVESKLLWFPRLNILKFSIPSHPDCPTDMQHPCLLGPRYLRHRIDSRSANKERFGSHSRLARIATWQSPSFEAHNC